MWAALYVCEEWGQIVRSKSESTADTQNEEISYDTSYGFKPGKSQHQPLQILYKERLIEFDEKDGQKPRSFDFLGFIHYWGEPKAERALWVLRNNIQQ